MLFHLYEIPAKNKIIISGVAFRCSGCGLLMSCIQGPVRNQRILDAWTRCCPRIYKLCCKIIKDRDIVNDAMQTVYIRFHMHYDEILVKEYPRRWLETVAANVCRDELRRSKRDLFAREASFRYLSSMQRIENEKEDSLRFIKDCLNSISPKMGMLVELHYFSGFHANELSSMFGVNSGTVNFRLRKSIVKMREFSKTPLKIS